MSKLLENGLEAQVLNGLVRDNGKVIILNYSLIHGTCDHKLNYSLIHGTCEMLEKGFSHNGR